MCWRAGQFIGEQVSLLGHRSKCLGVVQCVMAQVSLLGSIPVC